MAEQQVKGGQPEQDLNQLLKVRREKLAELQANGKDPFVITKYDQTAHSADIRANYAELEGSFTHNALGHHTTCDNNSFVFEFFKSFFDFGTVNINGILNKFIRIVSRFTQCL